MACPLVVRPRNRRDQRRGLSVAELARSSGFRGKSPEVYATSATKFPSVHAIHRRDQRRGLSVAELARSSGVPGKSTEVYATPATNFP